MARHSLTLSQSNLATAMAWVRRAAELGWRMEVKEPKRSDAQNDRLWEMLGRVSKRMTINGMKYSDDQWKVIFMKQMGKEVSFLPTLDGQSFFPTGFRSSDLSKGEMGDLQTLIESWAAEQGIDIWEEIA